MEMLEALAEVGVDEVAPCYLNGRLEEMEFVGKEIIPAVAALPAVPGALRNRTGNRTKEGTCRTSDSRCR